MAEEQTRPELVRLPPSSRFGRCDHGRFLENVQSILSVGQATLGEVTVDCRFLFTKSKWGKMGTDPSSSDTYPAGILYLDLDFSEPQDCRLQSAKVAVTLGVDEKSSKTDKSNPVYPATMTGHYGPKQLVGSEKTIKVQRTKEFMPHIDVPPYVSVGGMGISTEEAKDVNDRWRFAGHLRPAKGSFIYNRIEWDLHESALEEISSHGCEFHTAFAISHNAKAFHMIVEVKGDLVRKRDQFKQFMGSAKEHLKFGGNKANQAVVKFQWSKEYSSPKRLDRQAQRLPDEMERENRCSIPSEIPGPQQTTIFPATDSNPSVGLLEQVPTSMANGTSNGRFWHAQTLEANQRVRTLELIGEMVIAAGLESLAECGLLPQYSRSASLQRCESSSDVTLVESGRENESVRGPSPESRRRSKDVGMQPGSRAWDLTSTPRDNVKEGQLETVKAGILLGLLYWLQGLMVWEKFVSRFGVTADTTESDRNKAIRDKNDRGRRPGNKRLEPAPRNKQQWGEESEADTPVWMGSAHLRGKRREEEE
ncbi:hypothetical protein B0H65DRAFT_64334 [Neurospora tetraspora]|uniref:Uncharacterized protein n=1 Tax=Neurospora tetraspora TaxID=94610 RepID=A0AAE0MXI4_9PEZI|nr:hypothetical protein B0H65DRAFT_64334 [Neurospora tetraspora]